MLKQGGCVNKEPGLFDDATSPVRRKKAAEICLTCPIYRQCLFYHYDNRRETIGVRAAHNFSPRGKVKPIQGIDFKGLPTINAEGTIETPEREED